MVYKIPEEAYISDCLPCIIHKQVSTNLLKSNWNADDTDLLLSALILINHDNQRSYCLFSKIDNLIIAISSLLNTHYFILLLNSAPPRQSHG